MDIAHIISRHEKVYILADEKHYAQAEARFMKIKDAVTGECNKASEDIKAAWNIEVVCIETDDAWARDVCPTFVKNGHTGDVRGINWTTEIYTLSLHDALPILTGNSMRGVAIMTDFTRIGKRTIKQLCNSVI